MESAVRIGRPHTGISPHIAIGIFRRRVLIALQRRFVVIDAEIGTEGRAEILHPIRHISDVREHGGNAQNALFQRLPEFRGHRGKPLVRIDGVRRGLQSFVILSALFKEPLRVRRNPVEIRFVVGGRIEISQIEIPFLLGGNFRESQNVIDHGLRGARQFRPLIGEIGAREIIGNDDGIVIVVVVQPLRLFDKFLNRPRPRVLDDIGIDLVFQKKIHIGLHFFVRSVVFARHQLFAVDQEGGLERPSLLIAEIPHFHGNGHLCLFAVNFQRKGSRIGTCRHSGGIKFHSDALITARFDHVLAVFFGRFHRKQHIGNIGTRLVILVSAVVLGHLNILLVINRDVPGGEFVARGVFEHALLQRIFRGMIAGDQKLGPLIFALHHRRRNFCGKFFVGVVLIRLAKHFPSVVSAPDLRFRPFVRRLTASTQKGDASDHRSEYTQQLLFHSVPPCFFTVLYTINNR